MSREEQKDEGGVERGEQGGARSSSEYDLEEKVGGNLGIPRALVASTKALGKEASNLHKSYYNGIFI